MLQTATKEERVPWDFTQGDRLKRALKFAGISRDEMADYLGVAPATVSTWMNDRITPNLQTLRLWSMRTGVPLEWLVHPPGLEPGTHCFRAGACIYCGEREDPTYLAPVVRLPLRTAAAATPPTSPNPSGGALHPQRSAAA